MLRLLRHCCETFRKLDESPWRNWNNGNGINASDLAKNLGPYGIRPRGVRIGNATPRGYRLADFTDAWRRYANTEQENT